MSNLTPNQAHLFVHNLILVLLKTESLRLRQLFP
jgi:hypothetical protein